MERPDSWLLQAKCVKKQLCQSEFLSKDASLLKMSLFHMCFFTHFAGKN